MSGPSEFAQEQQIDESDGVLQDPLSLNLARQTPNEPDPPSNPDPDPATQEPDGEEGQGQEKEQEQKSEPEEEKGGGEQETPLNPLIRMGVNVEVVPPIAVPDVSVSGVTLASPSNYPNLRRGPNKRKKAKPNPRKLQSIQRKLESLKVRFNPIPFIPVKILDFSKHEKLLKKLGLWDFVHIDFDRNIRVDLLEQLVVTYDPKSSSAYVNSFRFVFSRSIFAQALSLPPKKRVNACGLEEVVVLEPRDVSEDAIGFLLEFVSDWVLLHEDTWMTPHQVTNWLKLIKDGHPDKVDWAGLLRFMAENELKQGDQLKDCYYASHLQHLLKFQNTTLFIVEEDLVSEKVELEAEAKEEKEINEEDVIAGIAMVDDQGEKSCVVEMPSIELTLGQDGEKEENMQDVEMTVVETCKEDVDVDGDGDEDDHDDADADADAGADDEDREEVDKEQTKWLLHGKKNLGEHFLQPCSAEDGRGFGDLEDGKEDEVEEAEGDGGDQGFDIFPAGNHIDGEGLTGNFLQAMEVNQVSFSSQERLHDPSFVDTRDDMGCPSTSFFSPSGKRVIEHDSDIDHRLLNDRNKRLRIDDSWNLKPPDFKSCMALAQQLMEKSTLFFEEREQALEQANMNQQILLNELQKRDSLIDHLHKSRIEEVQKKDGMIYRLERELYLVESVMDGYRKTLKETQKAFAEYRQRAQLAEEPTYKDAGPGGLMLSTTEIGKLRQKREEEYKMNCFLVEQKWKEAVEHYMNEFDVYVDKINILDKKLRNVEADAKELVQSYGTRNVQPTEDKVDEASTPHPVE